MRTLLLVIGVLVFLEGLAYFLILPDTLFRQWLSERRQRWWMKIWPPVQWALDSEKARLFIGGLQIALGVFLILLFFS